MARPTRMQHRVRFERLVQLLDYLGAQIVDASDSVRNENLFRFLSRGQPAGIVSRLSFQRWLAGEQFVNQTARRKLAAALGIPIEVLEDFLIRGTLGWDIFVGQLPKIPEEYRQKSRLQVDVATTDEQGLVDVFRQAFPYLSLPRLVEVRDLVESKIQQEMERLDLLNRDVYRRHPLRQLIENCRARSGLSEDEFARLITGGGANSLTLESGIAILRGDRLPTWQELRSLSLYLKDSRDNYYPFDYLVGLLEIGSVPFIERGVFSEAEDISVKKI